ncbi:MAG: phenylalanine--tRNA ligase subunit beta [Candidatus Polarisedimenticolaceae bacterium]|nr:phenylalanine--tRNA ligase subunit beta [Candidatus Polarisedimenticolaceae bacterium]
MKFSEAWLREWVNPNVTTNELADQLSMAGLEVDAVEDVAAAFNGVVVGEVLTREQHPNADKLSVCTVDAGQDEMLQIICGAANVAAGLKVPVAIIGAVLPGDFKIKKAKLRGEASHGMICAASELGLLETSEGIMSLPIDAPIGMDFREYLSLNDKVIDVDLTPDRGDCLGLIGIAREVGVINQSPVTAPEIKPVAATINDTFSVRLDAPQACPRYLCRIIRNINATAETPLWMQERLRRSGLRSISPVVDVTNYVLLELGQPMHGFDLNKLDSEIVVRMAGQAEKLTLLDGQEIELREDTLLISDKQRPLAMAGIMGGEASGVTAETRDILFESAFFAPLAIAGKARSYGLHTDSSHRFERGVDPELQQKAMERATALLIEMAGGEPGPIVEALSTEHLVLPVAIQLRRNRVAQLLGVDVSDEQIVDILQRLDMQVVANDQGWMVTAPSCRFDISIEVDLIEEIGRIYGYANIPTNRTLSSMVMSSPPEAAFDLAKAKLLLVGRDYQEVITYSFIGPELQKQIDPNHQGITLANPISADMSVMRTSLWPGLLQTASYNQARQLERVRIFESGLRFIDIAGEISQEPMLAGLICGSQQQEQWGVAKLESVDFFDLKADLESVLDLTGEAEAFSFVADEHPTLHPGQSARVLYNGEAIGWVGMLHPEHEKKLGLLGNTFLFEIKLKAIEIGGLPAFEALSKYPSIKRDLAILVDKDITYQQVHDCIRRVAPSFLKDIRLFDVYTGDNIDPEVRSLALSLILQETSKTLSDQEVETAVTIVLNNLSTELKARLRD